MGWCEVAKYCDKYKRDFHALKRIESDYGRNSLSYKIVFTKLKQACNHNHMECKNLKKILKTKL